MKLNIGSGHSRLDGFTNLDRSSTVGADIVFDLEDCHFGVSIPLETDSVEEFLASHVFEHITNLLPVVQELHRIAKPGAKLIARVPYGSSDIAFEDPTHRRQFFLNSFSYFGQPAYAWMDYGYIGDWKEVGRTLVLNPNAAVQPESLEEAQHMLQHMRNSVVEFIVELRAIKPRRSTLAEQPTVPTNFATVQQVYGVAPR